MSEEEQNMSGDTPAPTVRAVSAGRPQTARLRAEPVREASREEPLQRNSRLQRTRKRTEDKFYIDPSMIPPGVSYEWKRKSCYGAEDRDHMTNLMDNHWQAVPSDRHPGMVTEKDGQILMERPKYLTDEARQEDYDIAMGDVSRVSQGLLDTPQGTMTRNHPTVKRASGIKKEFGSSLRTDHQGNLIVPE